MHARTIAAGLLVISAAPAFGQALPKPFPRYQAPAMLASSVAAWPSPVSFWAQGNCEQSQVRGRQDANAQHGTSGWMLGGVGSGLLLGLIGTGIITGAAASGRPQPPTVPEGLDAACYREGYSGRAKSKNTVSALTGGLIGTAVWVIIVVSATN